MSSSKVEELPHDFDERADLNKAPTTKHMEQTSASAAAPSVAMPPAMASVKQHTADEVLGMMNRVPLFMTSLDEGDGAGGENVALEALKALAYEGTRAEIAGNFREQGNDMARAKRWLDARAYYDKALAALRMPEQQLKGRAEGEGPGEVVDVTEGVQGDEHEEQRKQRDIEEAVLVNRALCNLEMKNYGSCNRDCAAALRMNDRNVKAWYRSAQACLALDKIPEAEDACARGVEVDAQNAPLKALAAKIEKRKQVVEELERKKKAREARARQEAGTLKLALKSRNIPSRTTAKPPEMEDAELRLADPVDPASTLSIPVMFLYPVHLRTDFIKSFSETESVGQHLTYTMPLPWDEQHEYTPEGVDCYIETISGGLIKAGKKLSLLRILSSGKVEVVDGMVKVNVLPRSKAAEWIEKHKQRRTA